MKKLRLFLLVIIFMAIVLSILALFINIPLFTPFATSIAANFSPLIEGARNTPFWLRYITPNIIPVMFIVGLAVGTFFTMMIAKGWIHFKFGWLASKTQPTNKSVPLTMGEPKGVVVQEVPVPTKAVPQPSPETSEKA